MRGHTLERRPSVGVERLAVAVVNLRQIRPAMRTRPRPIVTCLACASMLL
jgi:hypothetical protein